MNKGNNPNWARGPVGATLFTFKKFGVMYLEGLGRMYGNGAEGKKAFALSLAIMFLLAGAGGFPFADDLDNLLDGIMQRVFNKSWNTKAEKKAWIATLVGNHGADFVMSGVSGLPGVPIDVSGRLGMGHMIPGSGLLAKKADYKRDIYEIAGAVGSFADRVLTGAAAGAQGEMGKALESVIPVAVANLYKAKQMAELGYYQDTKGRKVINTTLTEAIMKGIGFQPASVKAVQDATGIEQNLIALNKLREKEISELWAAGRIERNPEKVDKAMAQLRDWNTANPYSPIKINSAQINKRVQEANMTKAQRLIKTAPKEIRANVRADLARELE